MAGVQRFEDLKVWRKARALFRSIYRVTGFGAFATDYPLKNQIRRAAISVPSNIAEGFERGGNKELIQYLATAKGSAGEVRCQIYLAFDAGYLSKQEMSALLTESIAISQLLEGFIRYLSRSSKKGPKYHRRSPPDQSNPKH